MKLYVFATESLVLQVLHFGFSSFAMRYPCVRRF